MSRTRTVDRFAAGARIGDYVVEEDLGVVETGMVYLGSHVVLPRKAQLKVMHASDAYIRQIAVKMLKEACLVEALHHAGVPRVYECGVLPDRRPWTAFEHVEGKPLASMIRAMAVADIVVMIRDVADILDHLHRRGIVHRRVTPDSLVRTPEGRFTYCLQEWSDACTLDASTAERVDTSDDIAALGVIAFRALTRARAESVAPFLERVTADATAERYPGAPRDVAELVDSMLVRDPTQRPTSTQVRDRARYIASRYEIAPPAPPPAPLAPDPGNPGNVEDLGGFAIRISGPRTR